MNKTFIAIVVAVLAFILSHQVTAQPAEDTLKLMSGDLVLFTGDSDSDSKKAKKKAKKDKKKEKKKNKKQKKKDKKQKKKDKKKDKKKGKKGKKPKGDKDDCSRKSASPC